MHIIVKNVPNKKKMFILYIYREMDVQRLLILDVREQIYFMKGKSMGLNKDEYIWLFEFN